MRRGAIIVLLAALCFVAYVMFALLGVEPIKVAGSRLIRSGDHVSVEGDLHNTGADAKSKSAISIAAAALSAPTKSPSMDSAAAPSPISESAPRKDDGIADFSIYLNHGRNSYGN